MALGGLNPRTLAQKCVCEFWMMCLFVMIGVGTAMSNVQSNCAGTVSPGTCGNTTLSGLSSINPRVFQIALAFGSAIMVLVFASWSLSGGHINTVVTTALMCSGHCSIPEGLALIGSQFAGAMAGCALLAGMIPSDKDGSGGNFGTNQVASGFSQGNAFCGEFVMSFALMFVIYHTAVFQNHKTDSVWANKVKQFAPIAIGMTVFCAHCVLIPITGCSINPFRSLAPLIVGEIRGLPPANTSWDDLWVFFVAPTVAGMLAGLVFPLCWATDEKADDVIRRKTQTDLNIKSDPMSKATQNPIANPRPMRPSRPAQPAPTTQAAPALPTMGPTSVITDSPSLVLQSHDGPMDATQLHQDDAYVVNQDEELPPTVTI
eukprot:TRINITY_DN20076_c0_g1_i2.p1 TRINITY_DN20076_c0_g1~~TRINITY_DN20076_c0_g1_i2.p1  ORF type:complete len:374 (+),score=53.57 TRINITY_DN20076_c0_g1_i2:176-1297(+)